MTIRVDEYFKSRRTTEGENPSIDLIYRIIGTGGDECNDIDIKTALAATAPATYDGLVAQSLDVAVLSWGVWEGVVKYGMRKKPEIGDTTIKIDTTGGTRHISQSLSTIGSYAPAGETAPDFKGAINVEDDNVRGVDIQTPAFNYNVSTILDPANVTTAYIQTLFNMTARVNNAGFKIFAAGECLFFGASLVWSSNEPWVKADFSFVGSQNATSLSVGDITVAAKKGWEYLWVAHESVKDSVSKTMVRRPLAAYVEQVFETGDFSTLGIGT